MKKNQGFWVQFGPWYFWVPMQEFRSEALDAHFCSRKRKQKLASKPFTDIFTRIQSEISWLQSLREREASNEQYQTSDAANISRISVKDLRARRVFS